MLTRALRAAAGEFKGRLNIASPARESGFYRQGDQALREGARITTNSSEVRGVWLLSMIAQANLKRLKKVRNSRRTAGCRR